MCVDFHYFPLLISCTLLFPCMNLMITCGLSDSKVFVGICWLTQSLSCTVKSGFSWKPSSPSRLVQRIESRQLQKSSLKTHCCFLWKWGMEDMMSIFHPWIGVTVPKKRNDIVRFNSKATNSHHFLILCQRFCVETHCFIRFLRPRLEGHITTTMWELVSISDPIIGNTFWFNCINWSRQSCMLEKMWCLAVTKQVTIMLPFTSQWNTAKLWRQKPEMLLLLVSDDINPTNWCHSLIAGWFKYDSLASWWQDFLMAFVIDRWRISDLAMSSLYQKEACLFVLVYSTNSMSSHSVTTLEASICAIVVLWFYLEDSMRRVSFRRWLNFWLY